MFLKMCSMTSAHQYEENEVSHDYVKPFKDFLIFRLSVRVMWRTTTPFWHISDDFSACHKFSLNSAYPKTPVPQVSWFSYNSYIHLNYFENIPCLVSRMYFPPDKFAPEAMYQLLLQAQCPNIKAACTPHTKLCAKQTERDTRETKFQYWGLENHDS